MHPVSNEQLVLVKETQRGIEELREQVRGLVE